MSNNLERRIQRLEQDSSHDELKRYAERLASQAGMDPDELWAGAEDIARRCPGSTVEEIAQWVTDEDGLSDAEHRELLEGARAAEARMLA